MMLMIDFRNWMHVHYSVVGTGAAELVCRKIDELKTRLKANFVVVADDCDGPTWRHNLLSGYKAGRGAHVAEFAEQMDFARSTLNSAGVPVVSCDGFEADDVIATIVEANQSEKIVIASTDKDLRQLLVAGRVILLRRFGRDGLEWFSESDLEKTGILPSQFVDWLALVGDATDCVPGAVGIGEVGATRLISEFKSLDGVFAARQNGLLSESMAIKIAQSVEAIELSKKLVALRRDVPIKHRWRCMIENESRDGGDEFQLICRCPIHFGAGKLYSHVGGKSKLQIAFAGAVRGLVSKYGFFDPDLMIDEMPN